MNAALAENSMSISQDSTIPISLCIPCTNNVKTSSKSHMIGLNTIEIWRNFYKEILFIGPRFEACVYHVHKH